MTNKWKKGIKIAAWILVVIALVLLGYGIWRALV